MTLVRRSLAAVSAALLTAVVAQPAMAQGGAEAELAEARSATEAFQDVEAAEAAGYVATPACVPGMGVHYVNMDLITDGQLKITAPEVLLYEPTEDGVALVGIEYMLPDADQGLETDEDRPSLFGVDFDGPMEGHGPGEPVHYDLHVALYRDNPNGMLATMNPAVDCAQAAAGDADSDVPVGGVDAGFGGGASTPRPELVLLGVGLLVAGGVPLVRRGRV